MPEDDYPDEPRPLGPVGRSGAVTAVGVVNYILGGLNLLCGVVAMVAGGFIVRLITGAAAQETANMTPAEQQKAKEALGMLGTLGTAAGIIIGTCGLIFAVLYILAGYGVINRRQWGRVITIILGILAAVGAVLSIFSLNIIGIVVNAAYAIFVLVVLFNSKNAAEFR
jgi:hypothetical protein